eukprot:gene4240-8434_t
MKPLHPPPEILRQYKASTPFSHARRFVTKMAESFQYWYQCELRFDVDEQCIPCKGRRKSRCYNPNKPEKFHFKCYALNDAGTGYMYNEYLYEGKVGNRPDDLAAALYSIYKLLRNLYSNKSHVVANDNWYTSVVVLNVIRLELGNEFVGMCEAKKWNTENGLFPKVGRNKTRREESKQLCTSLNDNNDIQPYFAVRQDNKPVHILSTMRSTLNTCRRLVQQQVEGRRLWEKVEISQPSVAKLYNKSMGGPDYHTTGHTL